MEEVKKNADEEKFTAVVEDARMKSDGEKLMLIIALLVSIGKSSQKIYETYQIENPNFQAKWIGRKNARALSVACGFEELPENVSELIGKKLLITLELTYDGELKIKKYEKLSDEPVEGGSASVLF